LQGATRGIQKYFGAFISGALTFFVPCGFTFAMQLYAMQTGSFWMGAVVMLLFAGGTLP
jgi:sulfite exporter TauE/SafE